MRLLGGEHLDSLARELKVTEETLAGWHDDFIAGGAENLGSSSRVRVRALEPGDLPVAADVLARAFDQDAAKVTMLPDSPARRAFLMGILTLRLREAMRYGTVHGAYVAGELGAVALWYPPGVALLSLRGAGRAVLTVLSLGPTLVRSFPRMTRTMGSDVRGFASLIRGRRPAVARATRGSVWRLDVLGTAPEHRGKGLARALLERQLHRCDQDGAAAWLEATDPVNPPLYERFGFATVAHIDGPSWLLGYWVMRREPHPAGIRRDRDAPGAQGAHPRARYSSRR